MNGHSSSLCSWSEEVITSELGPRCTEQKYHKFKAFQISNGCPKDSQLWSRIHNHYEAYNSISRQSLLMELVFEESRSGQIDDNRMTPRNEASKVTLEATSKKPTGIRKRDRERGCRRYTSSLETNKKKKKKKIGESIDLLNSRFTEISPNANFEGHNLIYPQNSGVTTHSLGYSTQLLKAMDALSTTNSLLLDSQIPATPSSLAGLEK